MRTIQVLSRYSPIKFMRANTKLFKVGEKLNFQIKQEKDRLSQSLPSKPSFCRNWQIGYFHQFQLMKLAAWNSHTNTSVSFPKACLFWNWQEPKWRKGKMSGSLEALGSSWYRLTSRAGIPGPWFCWLDGLAPHQVAVPRILWS